MSTTVIDTTPDLDLGFSETPDLVYAEDQLVSRTAVRLLDALIGGTQTYDSIDAVEDLAELTELGYVTVEDPRGGAPVITVTDFGTTLIAGVQAQHPNVLSGD